MARDTRRLVIGAGVLKQSADLFASEFSNRRAVIVADAATFDAAGKSVFDVFKRAAHEIIEPFVFSDPSLYAQMRFVKELEKSLAQHDAIPIAVGSGTINDIVKLAAHRTNRQYLCIATAASMDGYTAFGSSITCDGSKQTFDCPAPQAVLADLDVIAAAPSGMNAWGYADLLAKITAGADWIVADELGVEPIDPRAWQMVQTRLRKWIGNPAGVRGGDREALHSLICGLMMSGFAMQATCSSRPASGAEHQFSHLWDMEHHTHQGKSPSHGAKVGVATVAVAGLYEKLATCQMESIDVDSLVSSWPEMKEIERQIASLFSIPELAAKARLETRAKYIDRDALRMQLNLLKIRWPKISARLKEHLLPAAELAQRLETAGAPSQCEQIGILPARLQKSFRQACHIRRRFTVLDLAVRAGKLDAAISSGAGSQ